MPKLNLLPCPFCGSSIIRMLPQEYGYSVNCEDCGAKKEVVTKYKRQAAFEWNMRRDPKELPPEASSLKNLIERCNEELEDEKLEA